MKKVSGIDTIEVLKKGNIITLDDKMCFEPRYYRYNNEKNSMEYSDNKTMWKKSNLNLVDFTDNYLIIE